MMKLTRHARVLFGEYSGSLSDCLDRVDGMHDFIPIIRETLDKCVVTYDPENSVRYFFVTPPEDLLKK